MQKILTLFFFLSFCSVLVKAQPCQTITANVTSTSPAADPLDSNKIKICKGTTVTFTGSGTFSSSGAGATYEWHFNDGTVLTGTTVSQNFPNEGVYVVDFVVTDSAGCVNKNCDSRRVIQVSTTPHFDQTIKPDSVCINQLATLKGIVSPVPGEYNCAPPISDTTFLPDGNGVSYTTDITVSCFTPCDTVSSATDIESICLNMEHSYIGDLIVNITCPNGQNTLLFNGNGATNLGTYLGEANDESCGVAQNMVPGVGYTYCFSSTAAWGTFVQECNAGNWVPLVGCLPNNSMSPGSYKPEGSYNDLIGCPLNGDWTITVTDDQGSDNGYIFYWGINFSQSLGSYSFVPTYPQQSWAANADIVGTSNGGADITIKPTQGGQHCYTFQVVDAFNCPYDTTVCLEVVDPGDPGLDTSAIICLEQANVNAFDYLAGNPSPGGTWTGTGVAPNGDFDPQAVGVGTYDLVYRLSKWQCDTTATVTFEVVNNVQIDFDFALHLGCTEDTVVFTNLSEPGKYWWNYGDGTFPDDTLTNPTHIYEDQDLYPVRLIVKNMDGCIDSISKIVDVTHPLDAAFTQSADTICLNAGIPVNFTDASVGATNWNWNFGEGLPSAQQNPSYVFTQSGYHQIRLVISDDIPCYDTAIRYIQVDEVPYFDVTQDRYAICEGEGINLDPHFLQSTIRTIIWNFGDGATWNEVGTTSHKYENPGLYWITADADFGACGISHSSDSVVVNAFPIVDLGPDSVLCLDGPSITVADIRNAADPSMHWMWNTGAVTSSIEVVHPGTYSVTASKNDCATTETVEINKDCYTDIPNAFTPNGDGVNDYFYPKQLLSKGVVGFTMTVFDRWGQKIFETTNANGRGWDGRFNDKPQPMGVYIYQIKAVLKNGRIEDYSGNVTLMR